VSSRTSQRTKRIEIVAARDGDYLSLCVTTKRHGEGLGLTLVEKILLQHGFAFAIDSANGKTRFRMGMPATGTGYPPQRY
jgi:sensor histidine kinase regulating citrate/malate metabolism